jgi:hypothetical protein
VRKTEGKKTFGKPKRRWEDDIETDSEKKNWKGRNVLESCGSGEGQVAGSYERINETPNSMKCAYVDEDILTTEEGLGSLELVIRTCILKWILSNKSFGLLNKIMV